MEDELEEERKNREERNEEEQRTLLGLAPKGFNIGGPLVPVGGSNRD